MRTNQPLFSTIILVCLMGCGSINTLKVSRPPHIVFQPSHQSDTGRDFNEAEVCNGIIEAAMAVSGSGLRVSKVWSYDIDTVHHSRFGSNTKIEHTSARDSNGQISGYAYELEISNRVLPDVFVSVHNNGGTGSHACWGFIHEGDEFEPENRFLANELVEAICSVTDFKNRGVHGDSSPNRNDYRCSSTGKLAFYSLDENVNKAKYRVLLEIGDNQASYDFLRNSENQKKIGQAIQKTLERILIQ